MGTHRRLFLSRSFRTSPTTKSTGCGLTEPDFVAAVPYIADDKNESHRHFWQKRVPVDEMGICRAPPYFADIFPYIADDNPYITDDTPYIADMPCRQVTVPTAKFDVSDV